MIRIPESAGTVEKTTRVSEIAAGQILVEAGESTAGSAWIFASLMNTMLMLVGGRALKRYRRNALRRISSTGGRWVIVIRPRRLEGTRRERLPPQMVGC